MSETKKLFKPTLDNPFYKAALEADYSQAANSEELREAFNGYLENLVKFTSETLVPVKSISQTTEIFYFSTLSAALLQLKAKLRKAQLAKAATPEESLLANLREQFFGDIEITADSTQTPGLLTSKEIDGLLGVGASGMRDSGSLSVMAKDFTYTGSAMRALTAISVLNNCSLRNAEGDVKAARALNEYLPTELIIGSVSVHFPVIGIYSEEHFRVQTEYSPRSVQRHHLNDGMNNAFGGAFSKKLEELLAADDMDDIDRARTEELRDYYLEVLTGMLFQVKALNLPRVLSLASVVCSNADENGWVSEDTLNKVAPAECAALLSNESVLTRDYGDMNMTRYRVSARIIAFSQLTKRFNLLPARKQALLDGVVGKIQRYS